METAVHSGRREERVPLDALIELRSDDGAEVLEADGLDLSSGGLAMRAAFVPPIGAKLKCQFQCSPEGERVRAEGEVVWSHWQGDRDGAFGLRFLALDTKSVTAIRRHMEPGLWDDESPAPLEAPALVANMRIDGVGAPVEADVLFSDAGSIVLEQELNFLKLGRGVSIDVPGRGERRGRIGSVELRHGPLDVPTLVFGILLDNEAEASLPAREPEKVVHELALLSLPQTLPQLPVHAAPTPATAVRTQTASGARTKAVPEVGTQGAARPTAASDEAADTVTLAQAQENAQWQAMGRAGFAWLALVWARLVSGFNELFGNLRGQTTQLKDAHWPEARSKLAVTFARARMLVSMQRARLSQFTRQRAQKARATTPPPRVQRSSAAQALRASAPEAVKTKARGSRWLALGLAASGIGLGVYALAPRSGADRIRVRHDTTSEASPARVEAEPVAAPAPVPETPATSQDVPATEASPALAPALAADEAPLGLTFGEPNVPNGRMFSLRMSGPVEGVEGESREDGFTVRVPGRLALDRASPIATSHRAVARAMILNRGDYAELTVDFLPGLRPKYQVVGKDSAIEVTLERL